MTTGPTIFTVTDRWGDEIVLTQAAWDHAVRRHPEIAPYIDRVKATLEAPSLIYETPHRLPTKAFYARGLMTDPPYRGCYVAVYVRYTVRPAVVTTAYLPSRLSPNPGTLRHAVR